jgi:hypothetical protein
MMFLILLLSAALSAQASLLPDLQAARAKYPTPIVDAGPLLNEVALKHPGGGLQRKAGGTVCHQPVTNVTVACDILVHRASALGFDVLIDSENRAVPTWPSGGPADLALFVEPVGAPPPAPDPGQTHTQIEPVATAALQRDEIALLLKMLEQLEKLAAQQQDQTGKLEQAIKDLKAEIAKGIRVRW